MTTTDQGGAPAHRAPDQDVVIADGLSRHHGRGSSHVVALDDVSVRIARGTFTVLLGPSGSGKTTFLHLLAGLEQPDAGSVSIGGVDLGSLSERARTTFRRRYIGLVFQHSELVPYLTARQNVLLPYLLDDRGPDPAWMDRLTRALGIKDRLEHLPAQLSGGEEQRVALGRALATRPELVIADEPHGNLDVTQGAHILKLLRSAADRFGQTVLLATHDTRCIPLADRVLIIRDGLLTHDLAHPDHDAVIEILAS